MVFGDLWGVGRGAWRDVLRATRDGRDWTFTSKTRRVRYGYESPIRRTLKDEELVAGSWKIVADGTLETSIE